MFIIYVKYDHRDLLFITKWICDNMLGKEVSAVLLQGKAGRGRGRKHG